MTHIPLIRMNVLHGVMALLQQLDAPTEHLLAKAKLPPLILHEPETLIPLKQALHFIETAAATEGIDQFGLLAGQQTRIAHLGAFGRLLCHSLTLHDAIRAVIRLVRSYNTGDRIWIEHQEKHIWLCRRFTHTLEADHPQAVHGSLMILIHLVQLAAGSQWHPTEIHLTTPAIPHLDQIELFSYATVHFQQTRTAIAIPLDLLSLPLQTRDRYQQQQQKHDYEILQSSMHLAHFPAVLRPIIEVQLNQGCLNIESTAEILGISVRSFQRTLNHANLTYSHLIEQVRFERAVQLLSDPMNKVTDIAAEVGYKDAGNFTRAFKRWTGVSPKIYSTRYLNLG